MQHWGSERAAFGEGEDSMTRLEGAETGFRGRFLLVSMLSREEGREDMIGGPRERGAEQLVWGE